ncbi:MAG: hypothetical protein K6E38_05595 [Fretibacterium sp.]|nr:hypothetical protein [Fretibacterium sp.]
MKKFVFCLVIVLAFSVPALAADARHEAYMKAARAFVEEHKFPNGEDIEADDITADFPENKLAVCDVDSDGQPELLIQFGTGTMASMQEFVCGFDEKTKKITIELFGFPAFEYLDNGCVKLSDSHNQGLAGEFWPFSILKYNAGTGEYELMGHVDAWSEEDYPRDFDDKPFPKKIDADGDGFVFFIEAEGFKGYDEPVDTPVYEKWVSQYISGANPIEPEWFSADAKGLEALNKK